MKSTVGFGLLIIKNLTSTKFYRLLRCPFDDYAMESLQMTNHCSRYFDYAASALILIAYIFDQMTVFEQKAFKSILRCSISK